MPLNLLMLLTIISTLFNFSYSHALQDMFLTYKEMHSTSLLKKSAEELCSLKYVYSNFQCNGAGNFVSQFLNEIALAVVLNRTIVVDYKAENCFGVVDLADWVIRFDDLKKLVNGLCPLINEPVNYGFPYRCCVLESINTSVISVHQHYNLVYEEFRPQSGALLSPAARNRANLLFDHPNGLGRFIPFGFLHSQTIEFTDKLRNAFTDKVLAGVSNNTKTVTIGLHVRHWGHSADEKEVDAAAEKCIIQLKMRHVPSNKKCLILFASDRSPAFERFRAFAPSINCEIRHVERNLSQEHTNDHGPWGDSEIAMADWALLTHSSYYIGLHVSTFSMIMANVVAYNAWLRNDSTYPLLFMKHSGPQRQLECVEYQHEEPSDPCRARKYHYNPDTLKCMPMTDEL